MKDPMFSVPLAVLQVKKFGAIQQTFTPHFPKNFPKFAPRF